MRNVRSKQTNARKEDKWKISIKLKGYSPAKFELQAKAQLPKTGAMIFESEAHVEAIPFTFPTLFAGAALFICIEKKIEKKKINLEK